MTYTAVFAAPDGAYVHEGTFETVDEASEYIADVGSRWIFYPVCFVADSDSHEIQNDGPGGPGEIFQGSRYDDLPTLADELAFACGALGWADIDLETWKRVSE